MRNSLILLYLLTLQALDVLTTEASIRNGSIELNPLYHYLGPTWFAVVKLLAGLTVYIIMLYSSPRTRLTILLVYSVVMIQAILNNFLSTLL